MTQPDRLAKWKAFRAKLQADRCAMGSHHWIEIGPGYEQCADPGCGKVRE